MVATAQMQLPLQNTETQDQADFSKSVDQFVKLRDKVKAIKDRHKTELEPYNTAMEQLNALLLSRLEHIGADSVKTGAGTVYRTERCSASIADMTAFWNFVTRTDDWNLVDRRANVSAVKDAIDDGKIVPGVNFTRSYIAGVRRA